LRRKIGDPILQPGLYERRKVPKEIEVRLSWFVPIKFMKSWYTSCNYVGVAIAERAFHELDRKIYWIGYVKGDNSRPKVRDLIEKTRKTTNFTPDRIIALNVTINVNYHGGRVARFCKQIVTTCMPASGDSGSLVVTLRKKQ